MQELTMKRMTAMALALGLATQTMALTLPEAVRTALEENPDVEAAEQRVQNARALLRQAESAFYPWISAAAQYARSDNPPQAFMMTLNQRQLNMMDPAFNPNQPSDTDNLRASLKAQWRLFDGGRREADVRMARLGAEVAAALADAARNQIAFEVTRAFFQTLQAAAFTEVQKESLQSIEESLRIARERFQAGQAMKTDVLALETQRAQAQEDLIRAENGRALALAALHTILGRPLAEGEELVPPTPSAREAAAAEGARAVASIERRPEWQAARRMVAVQEQALLRARREHMPTLSAFASSDWDSPASSDFESSYTAGLLAEVNLFDGFRTRGARAAARAQLQAAESEASKTADQLQLDLTRAQLNLREARQRLEVTEKNLETAREALRITREQYEQGAADVALLLQAQLGVTAMRIRHIAAQYDHCIALADWRRARGVAAELPTEDGEER